VKILEYFEMETFFLKRGATNLEQQAAALVFGYCGICSLENGCYTRGCMSPAQEQEVCDALVNLGPIETEQGLHAEGVRAIQGTLTCSMDDARAALHDLRARQQIQETASPSDERADYGPLPVPLFRWVRPGTPR
jgi:hypothetical protein